MVPGSERVAVTLAGATGAAPADVSLDTGADESVEAQVGPSVDTDAVDVVDVVDIGTDAVDVVDTGTDAVDAAGAAVGAAVVAAAVVGAVVEAAAEAVAEGAAEPADPADPADPTDDAALVAHLQVDVTPLADVRARLRDVAAAEGWAAPVERTLLLLATELVANAQNHGPTGGRVVLRLARTSRAVHVAVDDDGAAAPVVRTPPPDALDGRGMLLVQHLAQEWGSAPRPDGGKTVWFVLPVDAG